MGVMKRFDEQSFAANDTAAINAVLKHLLKQGSWARKNDELYQPDILLYNTGFQVLSYIEVEIKHNWKEGTEFPFDTVNLPERKGKYRRKKKDIEYWILRKDLGAAVIIPEHAVVDTRLVEVRNRLIPEGEMFFSIPIDDCNIIRLQK